jgi:polyhydroxyalkanoate synthesis regulator phasin
MPKTDKDDKNKRSRSDTARRIWLAGIGAYGRAITETQEAIKDVTGKGSDVFDDLVQKGEMLEMVGKAKGKEMLEKAHVPDMPDFDLEDRIKAMRARLSRAPDIGSGPEMEDFETRLSAVETKLDKVLALLDTPKAKPKPKKTTPRKKTTTTQRTKKTASKKPRAKKT